MFNKKVELKIALIKKDITQAELAKRLGVTPDYISHIIGGIRELSYLKQIEVARILGVPREILFK